MKGFLLMQKEYEVGRKQYFAFGLGNFASQLSWTMVSTYLSIFYTDVVGLAPAAISILFLVAKIWDGINDPMMGAIMQMTNSRWGRFRPYVFIGAPILVILTILTFTVPGFGSTGKLVYAYVTYIGLGMTYTMTNVPYQALPNAMTRDNAKINRLMSAETFGMMIGMTVLNLVTLPLVNYFEKIKPQCGYRYTAALYAVIALPMFWYCVKECKENIIPTKEEKGNVKDSLKLLFTSKNMVMVLIYDCLVIMGAMGRIAVAVYFYLYVVNTGGITSIYMMMPMFMGVILTPFAPKIMDKLGKRMTTIVFVLVQSVGLLLLFVGPSSNKAFVMFCVVIYGLGALKEPALPGLLVDALDEIEYKTGKRPDGIAFSLLGLGNKIGNAIGSAIFIAIIGWYGYKGGVDITPHIQSGINIVVNLLPVVLFIISLIPVFFFTLKESDLEGMRAEISRRHEQKLAEQTATENVN